MSKNRGFMTLARKTIGTGLVFAAMTGVANAGAPPSTSVVPEIDPGSVLSAMTLLGGGLMILADRRRSKLAAR